MIKIIEKENCTGCYSCFNICPTQCITMEKDDEGFSYPIVHNEKCINCNLCEKHCHIFNKKYYVSSYKDAYACRNKNDIERLESSSGGIFVLLAKRIIQENGIVYGALINENNQIIHSKVETLEDIYKLQGSKYVQSELYKSYKEIKEYLSKNKLVYFSGTPCQIDGLYAYLGKEYNNLICQDIICHGVPSPKIWDRYLKENNVTSNTKISFRDKSMGWRNFSFLIDSETIKIKQVHRENEFMNAFLKNYSLRPSCYSCQSKSHSRNSDITLGDFWGVENFNINFSDDKGVSLVLVNTEKGKELFNMIKNDIFSEKVDRDEALKYNPAAFSSVEIPAKRNKFFELCKMNSIKNSLEESTRISLVTRIKIKIYNVIHRK